MGCYEHGLDAILAQIHEATGLQFDIWNSGGWTMILEARLEGGFWMWVTDFDADVTPLPRRRQYEADGTDIGWRIGLYPSDSSGDTPQADDTTLLASVTHPTAHAEALPELVLLALKSLSTNAHHTFNPDGTHSVTHGAVVF